MPNPIDPRVARTLVALLAALLLLAEAATPTVTWAADDSAGVESESAAAEGGESPSDGDASDETTETTEAAEESGPRITPREASLSGVLAARRQIEADLLERQKVLVSDSARGRELEIEAEIRALSDELGSLNRNFSELAAGVDPISIESDQAQEQLNLTSEVRELLGPLVNELKRATSRPREIDRLRTEISELEEHLGLVQDALARLQNIEDNVVGEDVREALQDERDDWNRRKAAMSTSLQVAQQKLDQRLGESQSITQAVENLFQIFFKSRGRNLLLALVAMIAFLVAIRRFRAFLAARPMVSNRAESFEGRVLGLISSAFTVIGAVLVFLISLYFFGDWVLLILVLLLILGLIWTVLILDMGVVREGERVFYNGIPWRVESISFYSILTNPALVGGRIRLPIDDLSHLRSRAHGVGEPWFPTDEGDVILMPDGRPARVEFQSIENVKLRMPGNNTAIVPAAEFAGQAVERLSDGYRVDITFGLDYADQAEITTTMRDTMEREVEAMWRESRWADALQSISVEFENAGASSLDYFVRVDLDGSCALELMAQKRMLARCCVDVCNRHGWVIPFSQLTLHVASTPASGGEAASD
jgi:uncharacterized membrane protein YbaN (DUF454 family)